MKILSPFLEIFHAKRGNRKLPTDA